MCEAAWGYCKWTDDGVGCANGKFLIGKCAGPENRKCCVRDGKNCDKCKNNILQYQK